MTADLFSRPSGFARWGWLACAINAVLVLANIACLVFLDGGWLNWMAVVICTASGIYAWHVWRKEVRDDAAHRAFMRASYERWTR